MRLSYTLIGIIATCVGVIVSAPAFALENRVTVESRTFYPGQAACTVGVYFENAVPMTGVVLPLELRSIDPGAYPASGFKSMLNPAGRVNNSPLGICYNFPEWPCMDNHTSRKHAVPVANQCSGPISHSWNSAAANIDYVSPDAMFFAALSIGGPNDDDPTFLFPGSDPQTTSQASYWLIFGVGMTQGQFEIDTCCTLPMNHLAFVDSNTVVVAPSFNKGIITIACQCPCAKDPNCDGVSTDILDVLETINVAFRAKPATTDPGCSRARTDVDCNGVTDVVDAVRVAMVAFAGFDPALLYCEPCD